MNLHLRVGVVGRFRPGHALDRALAEARRVLGQLLLDHVGRERRDRRPGARQHAEERAERGAAQDRAERALEVVAASGRGSSPRDVKTWRSSGSPRLPTISPTAKTPDRDHDEADAVRRARRSRSVKRAMPEFTSVPTMPSSRPSTTIASDFDHVAVGEHGGRDKAHQHQREVLGRAELQRHLRERRTEQRDQQRARRCRRRTSRSPRSRAPARRVPGAPSGSRRYT